MKILRHRAVYLMLSLAAPLYYGTVTLSYVFSHDFIVQDDMRQHVAWFQQFIDPTVFQQDAIAHYFRSVAPVGFKTVYWLGAQTGVPPLLLAKLLPLPLALAATLFLFYTTLEIAPSPLAAWLATLIFNQHLWLNGDLVSATPRAFVYPLFAAFLYFVVQRSLLPMLMTLALLGLFFPQMMLVGAALLLVQLLEWSPKTVRLTRDRQRWGVALSGLVVATVVAMPFTLSLSDAGPAITADQMQAQLEYGLGGRSEYFGVSPVDFILHGSSGLRIPVFPSIIWAGFALPFLMKWRSPVIRSITPRVRLLIDLMTASLGLFFLAHLLLLRLHFPSRYTYHSWRFVLSIAAGIVLAALVEAGLRRLRNHRRLGQAQIRLGAMAVGLSGLVAAVVIGVPLIPPLIVAFQEWEVGDIPTIYTYLAAQPADTLVASLSPAANNIPAFSQRSTWVGREFALPHHPQYYAVIRDRTAKLLQAQYSPNISDLQSLVDRAGIDFFLIERSAFDSDYLRQDWLLQTALRSQVEAAISELERGRQPAIVSKLSSCGVVSTERYVLVKANCL